MNKTTQSQTFEDAILVGILKAMGCAYAPQRDPSTGRVIFEVTGDVEQSLKKIYSNESVPALDVLQSIKNARQAIFSLKGNGYGYEKNHNK